LMSNTFLVADDPGKWFVFFLSFFLSVVVIFVSFP